MVSGFSQTGQRLPSFLEVGFPLFWEKFDGAEKPPPFRMPERLSHGRERALAAEEIGFPAEFGRGMAVGVGDKAEAVEGGNEPVHRRVRGEAGFEGEDMFAQVAETFLDGVEP